MKTNITALVAAILISLGFASASHAQLLLPNTPPQQAAPKGPDMQLFAEAFKKLNIPFAAVEAGNQIKLRANVKLKNGGELITNVIIDKGSFWMISELAQVPQGKQLSAAQAMDLLEVNAFTAPCFFTYQRQTGTVALVLEITSLQVTDKSVMGDLELLSKNVLNTQKYWTLIFDGQDMPVPVPTFKAEPNFTPTPINNTPIKPIAAQPTAINLTNSVWAGEENLVGYSKLAFEFQAGNVAIMHDTDGATKGVYRVAGNQVTLTFGGVAYQGTINGNAIVGNATNGKTNWTYRVNLAK